MELSDIAKRSLTTLWTQKHLWFFGFFVAVGSGGGGGSSEGQIGATMGALPTWVFILMGIAAILGLVFLALHVLSEAALIEGVADGQNGKRQSIGQGLRRGRRHFFRLVGLKLVQGLIMVSSIAVIAVPAVLGYFGLVPLWLGVVVTVLLGLAGVPWLLTVHFIYEYAMRMAVLEDHGPLESIRHAKRFLHGRLVLSIKLSLLALLGQLGGNLVMGAVLIPAALLAGLAYLIGGLMPAAVLGGVIAIPLIILVVGASGTFRSSVWTLGFIDNYYQV